MQYYCNICKNPISNDEYRFSKNNFDKPLCKRHQPTPEATKLGHILNKIHHCPVEFEKKVGRIHIDIAITDAGVNIEVDGKHHNLNPKQALSDLKRTYYSFKNGFTTLRIPNCLVRDDNTIKETADYIVRLLNESNKQLEEDIEDFEDDYWL
jgi:very-short-patch-repair endonuclease